MGLFRLGFQSHRLHLLHSVPETVSVSRSTFWVQNLTHNKIIKHFALPSSSTLRSKLVIAKALSTEAGAVSQSTKMVKAIRVHEHGGPEVLKWEDVELGEPKEGEIRVKNKVIGVNFIDIYFRKGVYKTAMPFTPGMEAVGEVTAVGPGLTGRKVGDVVAYGGNPIGSYAEEQILPADKVVPVPPSVDPIIAASIMLKGMTAQFLLRRCFKVESGHTVLVHAAAGGVGSLLCQWANALGATVIGTVSSKEKAAQAKEDGCHHTIIYKEEDFVTRVNEITSGQGVEVVYDSVGKDTFEGSLACLKTRGYMVNFGQSSGIPDPVPLPALAAKSLFLTRPSLMQYTATRDELLESAGEVFANVASGVLRVRVNHKYPLSQAAEAHADLENRRTSGSVVLIP
ncbi:Alcohol dehydrogenase superfamily, zinc-type [Corchorus capsularis]|uniref:Probable quinone oxidoreductase n=1 Tax=Corchorus capsularis TaxID=210143 RepID=A0A1R3JJA5_COCAP|nr:Alcohol dehydrogenase superfamily, zinc-type [Corchorus capsularis]